jgi:2'-hydroxyisoflavone reductase
MLDADVLTNETYGPCKVACEEAVRARYGDRATIVRPGKVAGPHDNQNTFTYWVRTAAAGGRVELPGDPDQPTQIIDSRDLARLVVRLLVDDRSGAYNAVGPAEATTLGGLIATCARVAGAEVDIVAVPEVASFPLVRPRSAWTTQQRSSARAHAAGMPATTLEQTAADVLAWDRQRGLPPFE